MELTWFTLFDFKAWKKCMITVPLLYSKLENNEFHGKVKNVRSKTQLAPQNMCNIFLGSNFLGEVSIEILAFEELDGFSGHPMEFVSAEIVGYQTPQRVANQIDPCGKSS